MTRVLRYGAWVLTFLVLLEAQPLRADVPRHDPALPPGVEAAQIFSTITGIALSPLLGLGGVGAWRYFHTPVAERATLPWFASPWCWCTALLLVGLCFIKDTAGTLIPTAFKKPFDVLELFENKLSALVATGAIVPMLWLISESLSGANPSLAGGGFAAIDGPTLLGMLAVPLGLIAYVVVFLASHALNVLILLSPFAAVDMILKSIRLTLLAAVTGSSFLNATFGAICAGLIVIGSMLIAGWAFRLMVFGHVFAWDLVSGKHRRFSPDPNAARGFLARRVQRIPTRTYGRVVRDVSGELRFQYRPWLILPARAIPIPGERLVLGRGFLYPALLSEDASGAVELIKFPPRYRTWEPYLAGLSGAGSTRDAGIRAAWVWLKQQVVSFRLA